MYRKNIIAFTGGGTGGHVFPGLSIIEKLNPKIDVLWIGSSQGPEKFYVTKAGIPFYGVPSGKLRRYFSLKNVSDVFKILFGILRAKKLLKDLSPSVLVSIGGYVSVPSVIAAHMLKIPILSVVCDLSLGLATKINAHFSATMLFTYKNTLKSYAKSKYAKKQSTKNIVLGMPIRESTLCGSAVKINKTYNIDSSQKVLLVLGGSAGSSQINKITQKILPHLKKTVTVLHQTGHQTKHHTEHHLGHRIETKTKNTKQEHNHTNNTNKIKAQYISMPFFTDNYGSVLKRANVALTRAGASTLWDLINAGIPSVVIPLAKNQSRGDQIENAEYFADAGAIENIGSNPNIKQIQQIIDSLLYTQKLATRLKKNCLGFSASHSSAEYAKTIESYL